MLLGNSRHLINKSNTLILREGGWPGLKSLNHLMVQCGEAHIKREKSISQQKMRNNTFCAIAHQIKIGQAFKESSEAY